LKVRKTEKSKTKRKEKKGLHPLVVANIVALLVLFTVSVTVLWALGLFGSILAFLF
jgi:hypothetical protein